MEQHVARAIPVLISCTRKQQRQRSKRVLPLSHVPGLEKWVADRTAELQSATASCSLHLPDPEPCTIVGVCLLQLPGTINPR
eukprot:4426359-Alexandrium_andersonii.AAC.1